MSLINLIYNVFKYKGKEVYEENKDLIQKNEIFNEFTVFSIKGTSDKFKKIQKLLDDINESSEKIDDSYVS